MLSPVSVKVSIGSVGLVLGLGLEHEHIQTFHVKWRHTA